MNQEPEEKNIPEDPIDAAIEGDGEKPTISKSVILHEAFDWLETIAFSFAFVVIVFTFMFRIVTVDGTSMWPTLDDKDILVLSEFGKPSRGDIVVLNTDFMDDDALIKRFIADDGETVDIDFVNWRVSVDGTLLDEPYINRERYYAGYAMNDYGSYTYPHTVSDGHFFVMGDNRNGSADSRDPRIGEIEDKDYVGKVLIRLFPFKRFGVVKPVEQEVPYNAVRND